MQMPYMIKMVKLAWNRWVVDCDNHLTSCTATLDGVSESMWNFDSGEMCKHSEVKQLVINVSGVC